MVRRIVARRSFLPIAIFALALIAGSMALFQTRASSGQPSGSVPPPAAKRTGPVPDETYRWRPVAIGGGGFITGLSADATGRTFVARADVYGAYIWRADLDRWEQLVTAWSMPEFARDQNGMNEGVYEIAVAPSDPNRIYMAIKGAVFRTNNRGRNWLPSGGMPQMKFEPNGKFRMHGPFLAVSPKDPNLAFFGSPFDGAWRTQDGGKNWSRISTLPASADLRDDQGLQTVGASFWFEPKGKAAWAFVPGVGMFVSRDGGAHFTPLQSRSGEKPTRLKRGTFTPSGEFYAVDEVTKSVWRYSKGAWTDLTEAGHLKRLAYAAITADPRDGRLYLFDYGGRPQTSADGESWRSMWRNMEVGEGDPPWLQTSNISFIPVSMIMPDPATPGRFWLATGIGPMFTEPGVLNLRMTWITRARGIEELVTNDVIQPPGGAPLFAAWDFGIHLKEDLDQFSTTFGPKPRVLIAAQQLDFSASNPSFIVTNASDTRVGCCTQDGDSILAGFSTDGGRTWNKFATLPTPPGTKADDPWRMAFGMIAVASDNPDNIVWAPTYYRSPFYTLDRGKSWHRVVLPGEKLPLTGTHGDWWMPRKLLTADRVLPGTFYLFHSGNGPNPGLVGLWVTRDGGRNWTREYDKEIAPFSGFAAKLHAVPGQAGHLYFTSSIIKNGDTRLRRSVDGGRRWEALDAVTRVDDIAFGKAAKGTDYPTLYISGRVSGEYGIWRSIDRGTTWKKIATFPTGKLDQVSVIGADPDVFGRVYLGYQGSSWTYGEPVDCKPVNGTPQEECFSVR